VPGAETGAGEAHGKVGTGHAPPLWHYAGRRQAGCSWTVASSARGRPPFSAFAWSCSFRASISSRSATRSTPVWRHWANMPSAGFSSSLHVVLDLFAEHGDLGLEEGVVGAVLHDVVDQDLGAIVLDVRFA